MTNEHRSALRAYLTRAAGEQSGSAGSYLYPAEMLGDLAVQLQEYGALFRDFTRIETSHGRPLEFPQRAIASLPSGLTDGLYPDGTVTALPAHDATFTQGTLNAYAVSSGVHQVSLALAQDATAVPVEDVFQAYAAESIGRSLSALSVSGVGSTQPLGVITALNSKGAWTTGGSGGYLSLTAAQAVNTMSGSTTELSGEVLAPATILKMIGAVDPAYYPNAKWYLSQAMFLNLCTVVDTSGQPIIRANGPRTLYGFPVVIANELPNLTASTTGGPVFGDLGKAFYWRDAGMEVQRLKQRFADYLQVGYVAHGRHDFGARDLRAAVTVQAAAT